VVVVVVVPVSSSERGSLTLTPIGSLSAGEYPRRRLGLPEQTQHSLFCRCGTQHHTRQTGTIGLQTGLNLRLMVAQ